MRRPLGPLLVGFLAAACNGSTPAVPEKPVQPAPAPAAGAGRVETRSFASTALGVEKDFVVYLPAGYDAEPDLRWPVFYYLHGLTGDETGWTKYSELHLKADALGLRAIVVMPDGDDSFYANAVTPYDYAACRDTGAGLFVPGQPKATTCVKTRAYEDYVVRDLIDHVDATFRTIASRDGRAIAGLSMGGFGALSLALRHKDLFAAAASHAGVVALLYAGPHPYEPGKVVLGDAESWRKNGGYIGRWLVGIFGPGLANWQAHDPAFLVGTLAPGELALYLDCGTEDDFALDDGAAYLHDLLVARRIDHEFFLGPGKHDNGWWGTRLPESLRFLVRHVAAPRRS
jgi:S-formylglutathione hydrolase FrmB